MEDKPQTSTSQISSAKSSRNAIYPAVEKPRSPGPAVYNPSNFSLVTRSSPQYSIAPRLKTKSQSSSMTPAANVYDRSNYKPGRRAPAYSFGSR